MTTTGRLYKSKGDRVLCGVSGGLAEYLDVDPSLVRLGWIVLACFTFGVAGLAYLLLFAVLPDEQDIAAEPSDTTHAPSRQGGLRPSVEVSNAELTREARVLLEVRKELGPDYDDELLDSFVEKAEEALKSRRSETRRQTHAGARRARYGGALPLLILGIGAAILLANFGSLSSFTWVVLCPLLLIGAGTIVLLGRAGDRSAP